MDGGFNGQIFIDKLAKLNNSQQSIETLSHWCIFHRKKARQVVETWDRQFHCSPPDQRLSFLYLANDILQNSRWKGSEFVDEFWKVLPRALNDVLHNGDEFGKSAAHRLINIWEDRKVFGSHGKTLKEELLVMKADNYLINAKRPKNNSKGSISNMMGKLVLCYEHVSSDLANEDSLLSKCQAGIAYLEEVEKGMGNCPLLGNMSSPKLVEEQKEKLLMLRECIQQLKKTQSSRESLVSHLRQALHEQEFMLNLVSEQLESAEARLELAADTHEQPISKKNGSFSLQQRPNEVNMCPGGSPSMISESQVENREKKFPVPGIYNQKRASSDNAPLSVGDEQNIFADKVESHAMMHSDSSDSKRLKLENDMPHTLPHPPELMPPLPPVPYSDSIPQVTTTQQMHQNQSPLISQVAHPLQVPPFQIPLQPLMQPSHASQYFPMPTPYNYGPAPLPECAPSLSGYSTAGVLPYLTTPNSYQNGRTPEESWVASQSFPGNPNSQP